MEWKWWQKGVVYQIYCKSFCDSNGDGIGDIPGVMSKLPVLKDLGVDCIWFTPIYTSPQVDNGYDVADYYSIDPVYGTMEDFKALLDMAHSMGIRVVMDMVLNHSSDECVWFQESRKSKDNPYRNYYIWQPPKNGKEPNNWGNYFREGNGSAWEFDALTGEYYLHEYATKMPDLNWEYEPMRQELYKMLRWWLDLGVDGFRLDVFTRFKKPEGLPDTQKEPNPDMDRNGFIMDGKICQCREGIHELLQDMHKHVFAHYDCYTVGEGTGVNWSNAADYITQSRKEVDSVYHFQLTTRYAPAFTLEHYRKVQSNWAALTTPDCWPTQYLSNHDLPRPVSRHGNDEKYRVESAKLLATLVHTMPGTPYIFQGEEIGMTNVAYDSIEDYLDCYTVGEYHSMVANGKDPKEALQRLRPLSRDNARTPYQWDGSENAGFSSGKPWLKVNSNYKELNLEADRASENSVFAYYQKLIQMRKTEPAILEGDLRFRMEDSRQVLMYTRACEKQTLLVIANKSNEPAAAQLPEDLKQKKWKRLLSNRPDLAPSVEDARDLLPWEAEVYTEE